MIKRILSLAALSLMVAACGGGDDAGEVVEQDTTAIMGTDTAMVPAEVQTTDSVVTTTTVDTIQGEANADSVAGDTTP